MKKFLLIQIVGLILISTTSTFSQNRIFYEFENVEMDTYRHKSKIDKCLLKYLKNQLSIKFDIVNPNKIYNATDVIFYRNKPSRALIFISYNTEQNLGLIFYKSGFIGKPYLCLLYKKKIDKEYEVILVGVNPNVKNLDMLQEEIRKKNYTIMNNGSI